MNVVILEGRPAADPELKETASGLKMTKFNLAVDRWNPKTKRNEPDFIRITAFGQRAEFAGKWVRKGEPVIVHGTIRTGSYTKRDGTKEYTTDIYVDKFEFALTRKPRVEETIETQSEQIRDDDLLRRLAGETTAPPPTPSPDDFVVIPDDVGDEGLPFN